MVFTDGKVDRGNLAAYVKYVMELLISKAREPAKIAYWLTESFEEYGKVTCHDKVARHAKVSLYFRATSQQRHPPTILQNGKEKIEFDCDKHGHLIAHFEVTPPARAYKYEEDLIRAITKIIIGHCRTYVIAPEYLVTELRFDENGEEIVNHTGWPIRSVWHRIGHTMQGWLMKDVMSADKRRRLKRAAREAKRGKK